MQKHCVVAYDCLNVFSLVSYSFKLLLEDGSEPFGYGMAQA